MTDGLPVVAGVGTSAFGRLEATAEELAARAVGEALADAGVGPEAIDAVVVGTVFGGPGAAHRALRGAGITGVPVVTVENACASGTLAVHEAADAVGRGRHRAVLALGLEKMTASVSGAIPADPADADGAGGLPLPGRYAMSAARYLATGAVTPGQLAAVAVKNHAHALENPQAHRSGRLTVDAVLSSRMIADPLTLLQCSPVSDGAAAAVIRAPHPHDGDGAVRVLASALRSGRPWPSARDRVWNHDLIESTGAQAYAAAGLTPDDIDVFEVHDAFSIGEIVAIQALGVLPRERCGVAAEDGLTWRNGPRPVNPSGGLLARGHPLGATGVAQVAEIVRQLGGRAGGRQVPGARTGLVETMGGNVTGLDGNGCVVIVLQAG